MPRDERAVAELSNRWPKVSIARLPELLSYQFGTLSHGLELSPDRLRVDLGFVTGLGRETSIGTRHDVFTTDQFSVAHKALSDKFRMLHDIAGMGDHARDDDPAF